MRFATDYGQGIYAIDADYLRPKLAAIHLVVENGRAAFFDTGCNHSLPNILGALAELGLAHANVDYVVLTHVHLDHAGGAGAMMKVFPNARLIVHPRGARHMIDPSRLIEGTIGVYGIDATRRLYGEILPIDANRVIEAAHEFRFDLAGREFLCVDTPGHARHHNAIIDRESGQIFAGDTFGISYPQLDIGDRQFIFPTTTPVQFDPEPLHQSIDLLMSYEPKAVFLTHFGRLNDPVPKAHALHRQVDAFVALALAAKNAPSDRAANIRAAMTDLLINEARRFGSELADETLLDIFSNDLQLNSQGLAAWLQNQ